MNQSTKMALTGGLAALVVSCTGVINPGPLDTGGSGGGAGTGSGAAGTGGSAGAAGSLGAVATDGVLPARVRRLTNAEYDESVHALLGTSKSPGQAFAPDTRQGGFTVNAAQIVDPVLIGQLQGAAEDLAHEAVTMRLGSLAPCSAGDDCARQIIASFGSTAYRRPVTSDETADLFTIYQLAAAGGTFAEGIERVIAAVLQSASFLYVTEIGEQPGKSDVTLSPYEIASSLSYLFVGGPPDDALLQAARAGSLGDPAERERQARRLATDPHAVAQRARLVKEWLGLDKLGFLDKTYQDFQKFRPMMEQETNAFIEQAFAKGNGLRDLLTSEASVGPAELASSLYQGKPRRGVLNQAAFLSVYGKANESDPVHRGVAVLRRLACDDIPSPASLNIVVVPPAPDPSKTTRERFEIHSKDMVCSSCHKRIDAIGFTFEGFDGMGRARTQYEDSHKPVNSATDFAGGSFLDGHYADSNDVIARLAASNEVSACFAKQLYHFASAQSFEGMDDVMAGAWKALPAAQQGSLTETLVAYAKSPIFTTRKVQP
jgi:hypothetical protein